MPELAMLGRHVLASILLASHRTSEGDLIIASGRNHNQHAPRELVEIHEAMLLIHKAEAHRINPLLPLDLPIEILGHSERRAAKLRARRHVTSMSSTASRVRRPSAVMFGGHHRS